MCRTWCMATAAVSNGRGSVAAVVSLLLIDETSIARDHGCQAAPTTIDVRATILTISASSIATRTTVITLQDGGVCLVRSGGGFGLLDKHNVPAHILIHPAAAAASNVFQFALPARSALLEMLVCERNCCSLVAGCCRCRTPFALSHCLLLQRC